MIKPEYGAIESAKHLSVETAIRIETAFSNVDEIKKPISVKATAYPVSCEASGTKTNAKAKVIFSLVYLSEDGYKKLDAEVDALTELSIICSSVRVSVKDVRLISNKGYSGVCSLVFIGEGFDSFEKRCFSGGEGVVVDCFDKKVDIYYKEKTAKQTVSDEYSLDFTVGEVVSYGAVARIDRLSAGLGKMVFEGEVLFSVFALPLSDGNDIIKDERRTPFRFELEDGDCLPDMRVLGSVNVMATNIRIFSDESKEKSVVTADVTLGFSGASVGEQTVMLVRDGYIRESDCKVTLSKVELCSFDGRKCFNEKVAAEGCVTVDGARVVALLGERVEVVAWSQKDGRGVIDGILKADVVFKNADNGISVTSCESPFSVDFIEEKVIKGLRVELNYMRARTRNGVIELEGELCVCYNAFTVEEVEYVEDIEELGARKDLGGAICAYIPTKGDRLWDVAKTLGVDGEEVLRFNPELEFPLTGDERIIIYRQRS